MSSKIRQNCWENRLSGPVQGVGIDGMVQYKVPIIQYKSPMQFAANWGRYPLFWNESWEDSKLFFSKRTIFWFLGRHLAPIFFKELNLVTTIVALGVFILENLGLYFFGKKFQDFFSSRMATKSTLVPAAGFSFKKWAILSGTADLSLIFCHFAFWLCNCRFWYFCFD